MINFDGSRLIMNGSGAELIAEIGLVISRMVSDFDCPPELLMAATKSAIKLGQNREKEDNEQCFSYSASDDSLPEEFKKELAKELHIPINSIKEVWLESEKIDGLVQQVLKVSFIGVEISKERLMNLPFKCIYENTIVFEIGDILL